MAIKTLLKGVEIYGPDEHWDAQLEERGELEVETSHCPTGWNRCRAVTESLTSAWWSGKSRLGLTRGKPRWATREGHSVSQHTTEKTSCFRDASFLCHSWTLVLGSWLFFHDLLSLFCFDAALCCAKWQRAVTASVMRPGKFVTLHFKTTVLWPTWLLEVIKR